MQSDPRQVLGASADCCQVSDPSQQPRPQPLVMTARIITLGLVTALQRRQPLPQPLAGEAVGAVCTAPTPPAYPSARSCQGCRCYAPGPRPALDTIEPMNRTTAEWYSPLVADPQTRRNPRQNPGEKPISTTALDAVRLSERVAHEGATAHQPPED